MPLCTALCYQQYRSDTVRSFLPAIRGDARARDWLESSKGVESSMTAIGTASGRSVARTGRRREEILDCAAAIATERGYDAANTRNVAEDGGVAGGPPKRPPPTHL